jgi:hypothetical protein
MAAAAVIRNKGESDIAVIDIGRGEEKGERN